MRRVGWAAPWDETRSAASVNRRGRRRALLAFHFAQKLKDMDIATGGPDVDVIRILYERKLLGLPRGVMQPGEMPRRHDTVVRAAVDQERRTDRCNLRKIVVTVARQAAHRKERKALRGYIDDARERRLQHERVDARFECELGSDPRAERIAMQHDRACSPGDECIGRARIEIEPGFMVP